MMKIDFKRLNDLACWLAVKAHVSISDVTIVFCEPYIRLVAFNGDVEHCYQLLSESEEISYHTKQYVKI